MTVVSLYVSVNWVKPTCSGHIYHNFSCCDDLSKFGKEYLNSLKCEFCTFFRWNCENFDILHAFLGLTVTKLSSLKTVRLFLAHSVNTARDAQTIRAQAWHASVSLSEKMRRSMRRLSAVSTRRVASAWIVETADDETIQCIFSDNSQSINPQTFTVA